MRLSIRLTLVMVALVAATAVGILLFTNHILQSTIISRALLQAETQARLLAGRFEERIADAKADVLILIPTTALREVVRARLANGPRRVDAALGDQDRLVRFIKARLAANPFYLQFSIIGTDDGGRELMRVDWSGAGHGVRSVPSNELQRRGETDYFRETIKLKPGEIHVSRVHLDRSQDRVAPPDTSVLQVATPIHLPDGSPFGIIVITADVRSILDSVRSITQSGRPGFGDHVYVVNDRGDYLIHQDRMQEPGRTFNAAYQVIDHMVDLAGIIGTEQPHAQMISDNAGERYGVAVAPVRPAKGAWFGVIVMAPYAEIVAPITAVQNASMIAGLIAILGAIALAALLARSIANPLEQMTRAIKTFTPGVPFVMPAKALNASGEIGVLAHTFEQLASEVTRNSGALKRENEEREQMKDEFVAMVSHELRTPLTSIAASLGLLVADPADKLSDAAKRLLRIAHSNSQRLVRLINDILDIEKIESGKVEFHMRKVDVRPLVEQAIAGNRGYASQFEVDVRLDPDAAHVAVDADIDRLTQVITNLLSNAVKYSPQGGEVLVTIDSTGAMVRIGVRDHGTGVPEKFRTKIFEKFAQADSTDVRQRGGTGLGLNIVKQIVVKLGGDAGFEAAPGGGTLFYVDLPQCDSPPVADHDADRSVVSAHEQFSQTAFELKKKEVA